MRRVDSATACYRADAVYTMLRAQSLRLSVGAAASYRADDLGTVLPAMASSSSIGVTSLLPSRYYTTVANCWCVNHLHYKRRVVEMEPTVSSRISRRPTHFKWRIG